MFFDVLIEYRTRLLNAIRTAQNHRAQQLEQFEKGFWEGVQFGLSEGVKQIEDLDRELRGLQKQTRGRVIPLRKKASGS